MQMPRGRDASCSFQTSALDGISCQRHAPAALYPQWWNPGTPWIVDWVCLRAGLDTEASGKSPHVTCMSKSLETPALDEEEKSDSRSSRLSPIPHWIWSCVDLTVELHVVAKGIMSVTEVRSSSTQPVAILAELFEIWVQSLVSVHYFH
jgi:hypothetical protein